MRLKISVKSASSRKRKFSLAGSDRAPQNFRSAEVRDALPGGNTLQPKPQLSENGVKRVSRS
jgi:hypothetical protein